MHKRVAFILLGFVLLISQFFGYQMKNIQFDYDFEKFFPSSDPETDYFFEFRKKFESDNDFVLVGIVNKQGVFNQEFLLRVDSLEKDIREVPNIVKTLSIVSFKEPVMNEAFGKVVFMRPAVHLEDSILYSEDSIRIYSSEFLKGNLISDDAKAVSILLSTKQYISKAKSDSLSQNLKEVISRYSFDEINVAGRSTGQSYYVRLMQGELLFFTFTSFILVVAFLAITFRTIWGIWVPIVVVLLTVVWILGFMATVGEGINLVLTILPTIMFVVGMSDVVHIMTHYLYELRKGNSKWDALVVTYKEVGLATFLTSVTTSVGFLTLLSSAIEPVRDFGLYTAIGIVFAYILAFTLLPGVLLLNKVPGPELNRRSNVHWNKFLRMLFSFTFRKRNWIIGTCIVLACISVVGITKIRFNNFLLEDLKSSNELKRQFLFFEEHFSGVRPFEMGIDVKEKNSDYLLDLNVLTELEKVETYLKSEYGTGFILSPNTVIKSINKASHSGRNEYYRLPETQEDLNELVAKAEKFKSKSALQTTVADNGKLLRISGKTPDLGSFVFNERNEKLYSYLNENTDTSKLSFHLTGTAFLIDKNNGNLSFGLVTGLIISIVVIGFIFGLMFKSLRIVLISLIPNLLPLLFIGGFMGFAGIDLKVSTSMIFTIAFGIAVDDSIHFLSRYKIERKKGRSVFYAIKRTYLTTGKAILVTTLILSGGFLTLIFSDFLGTFYIGLLIGLTLIFAVAMDMLLLPILLKMWEK